jgi:integrase
LFYAKGNCRFKHISTDYARKYFTRICDRVGLTERYAERNSISGLKYPPGKLRRWTTHALRYWFIRHMYKKTNDLALTSKIARHASLDVTMGYIAPLQEEINAGIDKF